MESNSASLMVKPRSAATWALHFRGLWEWAGRTLKARKTRRLRVCETLSLGERRFLAVVEFDHQEFLVGGSGNSLELLARLRDGTIVPESSQGSESRVI
jgi:flagellar biogenesis protein FliO